MAEERRRLEEQLGYAVCGINGCLLPNLHLGDCVFEFASQKRERRARLLAPTPAAVGEAPTPSGKAAQFPSSHRERNGQVCREEEGGGRTRSNEGCSVSNPRKREQKGGPPKLDGNGRHADEPDVSGASDERTIAPSRTELEKQLGYAICGINRCCLPYMHVGGCVFEFVSEKRERRLRSSASPSKATRSSVVTPPSAPDVASAEKESKRTRPFKQSRIAHGKRPKGDTPKRESEDRSGKKRPKALDRSSGDEREQSRRKGVSPSSGPQAKELPKVTLSVRPTARPRPSSKVRATTNVAKKNRAADQAPAIDHLAAVGAALAASTSERDRREAQLGALAPSYEALCDRLDQCRRRLSTLSTFTSGEEALREALQMVERATNDAPHLRKLVLMPHVQECLQMAIGTVMDEMPRNFSKHPEAVPRLQRALRLTLGASDAALVPETTKLLLTLQSKLRKVASQLLKEQESDVTADKASKTNSCTESRSGAMYASSNSSNTVMIADGYASPTHSASEAGLPPPETPPDAAAVSHDDRGLCERQRVFPGEAQELQRPLWSRVGKTEHQDPLGSQDFGQQHQHPHQPQHTERTSQHHEQHLVLHHNHRQYQHLQQPQQFHLNRPPSQSLTQRDGSLTVQCSEHVQQSNIHSHGNMQVQYLAGRASYQQPRHGMQMQHELQISPLEAQHMAYSSAPATQQYSVATVQPMWQTEMPPHALNHRTAVQAQLMLNGSSQPSWVAQTVFAPTSMQPSRVPHWLHSTVQMASHSPTQGAWHSQATSIPSATDRNLCSSATASCPTRFASEGSSMTYQMPPNLMVTPSNESGVASSSCAGAFRSPSTSMWYPAQEATHVMHPHHRVTW